MKEEDIKIMAELTPDPQVCRFVVDRPVFEGKVIHCEGKKGAQHSVLLEKLYELSEIKEVLVSGNVITVAKDGEVSWSDLGKKIGKKIREAFQTGKELFSEEFFKSRKPNTSGSLDSQIAKRVAEVLNAQINPAVSSHGGMVTLMGVENDTAYVQLEGGCQGCGMARMTLKEGIEKTICEQVPEIKKVVDVTEHHRGSNPFYK